MDDQSTHGDDDPELDIEANDASDSETSDTAGQETDSQGEQKEDALNLEAEKPKEKSKAEIARDKQVDAWSVKIASGEKSLDDLPTNLNWLKPLVEAKLGTNVPDVKETVAQVVKQERETEKFVNLQEDLRELPREKKARLKEKFTHFRSKGLSQLDALETAMETLNIDLEQDRVEARRQAGRLRTPGKYKAPGKDTAPETIHEQGGYAEVAKNVSPEKRLEYLKSLRGIRT